MTACTCRETPRERFENPDCPIHGWRETARRMGKNVALVEMQRCLDARASARELAAAIVAYIDTLDGQARRNALDVLQVHLVRAKQRRARA